jgi:outer membrane protein OmpA-like peptidoglycan-associated protein
MRFFPIRSGLRTVLAGSIVVLAAVTMSGQTSSQPPSAPNPQDPSPSRWDVFMGYSYVAPHGTVSTPMPSGTPTDLNYSSINYGAIGSVSYYFNRYVGGQIEYANHPDGTNDGAQTASAGIIFRYPTEGMTWFAHGLAGGVRLGGPNNPGDGNDPKHGYTWGPALTAGGGLDYDLPFLDHRFSLRLFQADYEYWHADFGPQPLTGGRANVNAARLSAGIVMHVGSITPPPPVQYSCSINPGSVYPGEQVTVTGTPSNLNPKKTATYSWSGQGLTVAGSNPTTTIDTANLQPGSFTVSGHVSEGAKAGQSADCTAQFTVKQFEPPTASVVANPPTVQPNGTSSISCTGVSPQNRPLTYSFTASAGSINGTGNSATLSTAGAPAGTITVTCNVQDDKGQTASSTTNVTVEAPPPPPGPSPEQVRLEQRLALHSVFFPTDQPRKLHPEGGLVESQQGTLTTLATDFKSYLTYKSDARITLTGHADVRGSAEYNQALTQRRVDRVKAFLVQQGIPESAIDTQAVGKEQQLSREDVKGLVDQNPELTDAQKKKMDLKLSVIYLAQNRRVDITLNNTGQQSVKLYPFNAADANTLMSEKAPVRKRAAAKKH